MCFPSRRTRCSRLTRLLRSSLQTVSSQDKGKEAVPEPLPPMQMSGLPKQTVSRVASLSKVGSTPAASVARAPSTSSAASDTTRRQSSITNPKASAVLRASRAHLPTISGSPSSNNLNGQPPSIASIATGGGGGAISTSSSYSRISDATPTKIPRIASRQSRQLGTPTSAQPNLSRRGSETATIDSFATGISRTQSNLSDFGPVDEEPTAAAVEPRYLTNGTRILADLVDPTSRRYSSISTSASTGSFTARGPRQLPNPPSSASSATLAATKARLPPSKDALAGPRRLPSSSSVNSGLADAANGSTGLATPRLLSKKSAPSQPIRVSAASRITPSSSTTSLATAGSVSRSASASPVVAEDDESVGDEEMRQFMKRQGKKKAASGATSAEIEAMMNYPEPVEPTPASTPLGGSPVFASPPALPVHR